MDALKEIQDSYNEIQAAREYVPDEKQEMIDEYLTHAEGFLFSTQNLLKALKESVHNQQ